MDKILLVEDEKHIAEGILLNLKIQGYEVELASDGQEALEKWKSYDPALIILDLMLPKMNGLQVLQRIRETDRQLPILVLSAKGTNRDKIKGLELGTDDYMSKPFELEELLLRVKRILERRNFIPTHVRTSHLMEFGNNTINFESRIATTKNGEYLLTENELQLLQFFLERPGMPLTREELLQVVWGYNEKTNTRTLDNFMVRFRKYFEENSKDPKHFVSIRSVGYQFNL